MNILDELLLTHPFEVDIKPEHIQDPYIRKEMNHWLKELGECSKWQVDNGEINFAHDGTWAMSLRRHDDGRDIVWAFCFKSEVHATAFKLRFG